MDVGSRQGALAPQQCRVREGCTQVDKSLATTRYRKGGSRVLKEGVMKEVQRQWRRSGVGACRASAAWSDQLACVPTSSPKNRGEAAIAMVAVLVEALRPGAATGLLPRGCAVSMLVVSPM